MTTRDTLMPKQLAENVQEITVGQVTMPTSIVLPQIELTTSKAIQIEKGTMALTVTNDEVNLGNLCLQEMITKERHHHHHELHLTKIGMIMIVKHHLLTGVLYTVGKMITRELEQIPTILLQEVMIMIVILSHLEKIMFLLMIAMKEIMCMIVTREIDIPLDWTITVLEMIVITSNLMIIAIHLFKNHVIHLLEAKATCIPVLTDATSSKTNRCAITKKMAISQVVEVKQPTVTTVPTESDPATKHR